MIRVRERLPAVGEDAADRLTCCRKFRGNSDLRNDREDTDPLRAALVGAPLLRVQHLQKRDVVADRLERFLGQHVVTR